LYCILSVQYLITLADAAIKLPEDGVRTLKHVGIVSILLILNYFYVYFVVGPVAQSV